MKNRCLNILCFFTMFLLGSSIYGAESAAKNVTNERCEIQHTSEIIPQKAKFIMKKNIPLGRVVCAKPGKPGSIKKSWLVTYRKGKIIKRELLSTNKTNPVEAEYHVCSAGYQTSRSTFNRAHTMMMRATAYSTSPHENGGYTISKTGHPLHYGIAAVDPKVIPLKSWLYVEGYGLAYACDIGGAIKGDRIDLCFKTMKETNKFGKKNVRVHILSVPPQNLGKSLNGSNKSKVSKSTA